MDQQHWRAGAGFVAGYLVAAPAKERRRDGQRLEG
jgi:hypothetical protein